MIHQPQAATLFLVGMQVPNLYLDPGITTWVLFPILWVMFCFGIIRFYALALMQQQNLEQSAEEHREVSYTKFAKSLRDNGGALGSAYPNTSAKVASILRSGSVLSKPELQSLGGMFNPLALDRTMTQLRIQAFTYLPQAVIMKWVSVFFSGLIVLKLPFSLSPRYKDMLQSSIFLTNLDPQWVSAVSWYVLLFVGINSIMELILPPAPPQLPQPITIDLFKTLADQIEPVPSQLLLGIEDMILST